MLLRAFTLSVFALLLGLALPAHTVAEAPDSSATFVRGVNLNGPAVEIDGDHWLPGDAPSVTVRGDGFENQQVPLHPPIDAERAAMIRSSRWGSDLQIELRDLPPNEYQVCIYVWEDNNSEQYTISLNNLVVVPQHQSGRAGEWKRLGPWRTVAKEGRLKLTAKGGAANVSGVEVWSGRGVVPLLESMRFMTDLSDEHVAFFENKIRPLFVKHCYDCHSQEAAEIGGGLLLDSRAGIVQGGLSGPAVVPGDPAGSLLLQAVTHQHPDLKMPPDGPLATHEIADLSAWIALRAPDPRTQDTVAALKAKTSVNWEQARDFWSLQPPRDRPSPTVRDTTWAANEIDRWLQARWEAVHLEAAPDANRRVLLRRATYDLIGLPPTPQELAAFEADHSPEAFSRVVDRLLASPHYGERWGRHWLDVVRYADTAGDNSDFPIPQMYKYRNWVIDALNRDLPYDQFVREQLAGDLLGGDSTHEREQRLIATGYIANARRFGSRVDDYPEHLTIEDTLDNLGRTFLGTTINCARCHNHKFDPITTEDYYALYGIFHSTRYPWPGIELEQKQRDLVPLATETQVAQLTAQRQQRQLELESRHKELEHERNAAQGDERKALDPQVEAAKKLVEEHSKSPLPYEVAYAVADSHRIEDAAVQLKGDPNKRGPVVARRFLSVLSGHVVPDAQRTSGRRALADWIVDPANPLAARVMANRIWQYHWGRGIVPTSNDFGRQGKPASHPELLDWLALRFVESGWSIKALHRTIMLSRTYQLASVRSAQSVEIDPTNELLASFPRRRLDAEALRDTLLQLGGQLDLSPGGPHPFPDSSTWKFTQHNPFKAVYHTNRRSVYLMTQRIQRHPYLAIFDGADPSTSTPARTTSTTPLQALYLLNDEFVHEQAAHFAQQLLANESDPVTRLNRAWEWALARTPSDEERQLAFALIEAAGREAEAHSREQQAWEAMVRALVRLNEFVYLD